MAEWEIEVTNQFEDWYLGLEEDARNVVAGYIDMLADHGPNLGRPAVDTLAGSKIPNLKELRPRSMRVLFVFDPRRTAILLLGGDKAGQWTEWYRSAIPAAERLYEEYVAELNEEGLL